MPPRPRRCRRAPPPPAPRRCRRPASSRAARDARTRAPAPAHATPPVRGRPPRREARPPHPRWRATTGARTPACEPAPRQKAPRPRIHPQWTQRRVRPPRLLPGRGSRAAEPARCARRTGRDPRPIPASRTAPPPAVPRHEPLAAVAPATPPGSTVFPAAQPDRIPCPRTGRPRTAPLESSEHSDRTRPVHARDPRPTWNRLANHAQRSRWRCSVHSGRTPNVRTPTDPVPLRILRGHAHLGRRAQHQRCDHPHIGQRDPAEHTPRRGHRQLDEPGDRQYRKAGQGVVAQATDAAGCPALRTRHAAPAREDRPAHPTKDATRAPLPAVRRSSAAGAATPGRAGRRPPAAEYRARSTSRCPAAYQTASAPANPSRVPSGSRRNVASIRTPDTSRAPSAPPRRSRPDAARPRRSRDARRPAPPRPPARTAPVAARWRPSSRHSAPIGCRGSSDTVE